MQKKLSKWQMNQKKNNSVIQKKILKMVLNKEEKNRWAI